MEENKQIKIQIDSNSILEAAEKCKTNSKCIEQAEQIGFIAGVKWICTQLILSEINVEIVDFSEDPK